MGDMNLRGCEVIMSLCTLYLALSNELLEYVHIYFSCHNCYRHALKESTVQLLFWYSIPVSNPLAVTLSFSKTV